MTSLFVPVTICENSKNILRVMAKIKADIDDDLERTLDNSADGEYMNLMKEDESFADDKTTLVPHHWQALDTSENFKEISSSVTYKLIPMAGDESSTNMQNSSARAADTTYFVISNPAEVFGPHGALGTPKKALRREPAQSKVVNTAKKRDDKRRATHNEVERRRRDKINNWIMKLAALVPNSGMPDSASKGGILAKACDHITDLTEKQKRLEKLEMDNEKLVLEVMRLNQELSEVRKENSAMRNQMADNCIVYKNKGQKSELLVELTKARN